MNQRDKARGSDPPRSLGGAGGPGGPHKRLAVGRANDARRVSAQTAWTETEALQPGRPCHALELE